MWQQAVPRCPAVRKEAAQRCLYRLFVVRLFGTWGAHGEHDTGAPRAAATRTAKLRQGRGTPRPLLLPPTWPGLPLPRPGQRPPPKGHQGSSLRGPVTQAPHSICRHGCMGTDPQGTFHFPSPRGGPPGCWGGSGCEQWRGGGRGGGRGRWGTRPGLSTRGWPRRGTARRPPSRPRCPRTCPALPVRSPAGKGNVSGPCGVWPSGSPSPWGRSLQGPPAYGDTVPVIPCASATTQPLASPSQGDRALSIPHLTGHSPWCPPSPYGMWLLASLFP